MEKAIDEKELLTLRSRKSTVSIIPKDKNNIIHDCAFKISIPICSYSMETELRHFPLPSSHKLIGIRVPTTY